MRRFLLSACIAGLTLVASPQAFAEDTDGCDMLCRLRSYLATDHMAPGSTDAPGPRAGGNKHTRSAAAAKKLKPARAAVPAVSTPKVAVAKPAPATKTAEARPRRPKTASVAETKPAPAPKPQRPRVIAETATQAAKTVVARTVAPAARRENVAGPAGSIAPKRVAARVATPATTQASSPPPVQTATAADRTTRPTVPIPGSAPLVAAGFR